jgi:hypothetical protein
VGPAYQLKHMSNWSQLSWRRSQINNRNGYSSPATNTAQSQPSKQVEWRARIYPSWQSDPEAANQSQLSKLVDWGLYKLRTSNSKRGTQLRKEERNWDWEHTYTHTYINSRQRVREIRKEITQFTFLSKIKGNRLCSLIQLMIFFTFLSLGLGFKYPIQVY